MSLIELFRNHAKRNTCNTEEKKGVTATDHATQGDNTRNTCNTENITHEELNEERAAVMVFDGGLTRRDAEQAAAAAIRVYCYRTTEKPNSELVAIMSGVELDEAIESLKLRYGDRLLGVYPSPYCSTVIPPNTTKH